MDPECRKELWREGKLSDKERNRRAEGRRITILQPVEQKPHSQKDRQDEKAEGYVPDDGTR